MHLNRLQFKNYRLFTDLEIPLHDKLTVLVGGNGAGKTSVLEGAAIAIGTLFTKLDSVSGISIAKTDAHLKSYESGSTDDVQAMYPVRIYANGSVDGKKIEWARSLNTSKGSMTVGEAKELISISETIQERLRKGDQSLILPVIAYYGTGRLWDNHREKRGETLQKNSRTNGYIDCLDGTANIKLMMSWFKNMTIKKYQRHERGLGPVPELEAVYQAIRTFLAAITGYSNIDVGYNLDIDELDIFYTDASNLCMRIPLSQMSAGYKGTISLIADIAYRMAALNPQLLDQVLTKTDGVVLIDEIDLHLHPQWQKLILRDLTEIFPKVQFIVTTHAPAVINSAYSENLVILKDSQIMSAGSQVYGKDVKSVLAEIMGVDDRPDQVSHMFKAFYAALDNRDFDNAEHVLNQLDELREYHDVEVSSCRVKLKMEKIRGGGGK